MQKQAEYGHSLSRFFYVVAVNERALLGHYKHSTARAAGQHCPHTCTKRLRLVAHL